MKPSFLICCITIIASIQATQLLFHRTETLKQIGGNLLQQRNNKLASQCFATAFHKLKGSNAIEEMSLRHNCGLSLAYCEILNGNIAEAVARCSEIIEEFPLNDANSDHIHSQTYHRRGVCLFLLDKPELSLLDLRKALRFSPDSLQIQTDIDKVERALSKSRVDGVHYSAVNEVTVDEQDGPFNDIDSENEDNGSSNNQLQSHNIDDDSTNKLSLEDELHSLVRTYMLTKPSRELSDRQLEDLLRQHDDNDQSVVTSSFNNIDTSALQSNIRLPIGGDPFSQLLSGLGGSKKTESGGNLLGGDSLLTSDIGLNLLGAIGGFTPIQMQRISTLLKIVSSIKAKIEWTYALMTSNKQMFISSFAVLWIIFALVFR